jgi:general secretion pathway protein H
LSALLETARAEARVSGATVRWVPSGAVAGQPGAEAGGMDADFRFVGLPAALALPTRWLDARVSAQVVGATTVLLGPEAMLPPQRVRLRLGERQLELASDGLGPFAPADAASAAQP